MEDVDEKVDLTIIDPILDQLDVPDLLFRELKKSIDYDGEVLDTASSELARLRHDIASNEEDIKNRMCMTYTSRQQQQHLSEQIATIRDDRYVIPAKQRIQNKIRWCCS